MNPHPVVTAAWNDSYDVAVTLPAPYEVDVQQTGSQGPTGEKGDKGDTGATGATGVAGPAGGAPFPSVAAVANLPAASAGNKGLGYYVTATNTTYVSNGTAWVLSFGDTGFRDITSLLDAGFRIGTVAGFFRLRRVIGTVFVFGRIQRVTAGAAYQSGVPIYTNPTGFVPAAGYCALGSFWVANAKPPGMITNFFGTSRIDANMPGFAGNWAVDDYVAFTATWVTADAWPTTLPGVAWP